MFGLENSANNFGASAGLLANTLANRPVQAALGTLFIGTNNLVLYRYNGNSWDIISSSNVIGATNGLNVNASLVRLGGNLIDNTFIATNNYIFTFTDVLGTTFEIDGTNDIYRFGKGQDLDTGLQLYIDGQNYTAGFNYLTYTNIGLKLDFANNVYVLGDFNANIGVKIDIINGEYYFGNYGGNAILYENSSRISLGDFFGNYNGTHLTVDDNNQLIYTKNGGVNKGLKLDFFGGQYWLGDYDNLTNQYWLRIDDVAGQLDLNGTNLVSGTASGFSGNHLSIYINSTHYKIKLENP